MTRYAFASLIAALTAMMVMPAASQSDGAIRELVNACVEQRTAIFLKDNARIISVDGGVTCPAADIVNFSERRHNRSGEIRLNAPVGWQLCEEDDASLSAINNNGGSFGAFILAQDRSYLTVPISCRGSGLTRGRQWFNATLSARVCPVLSNQERVDTVYECILLLDQ